MSETRKDDAPVVEFVRVSKSYGRVMAISDASLALRPGIYGLLGPNGAGKSTFMKLLAGLARPSVGTIRVLGESPFANPNVQRHIGYCPDADALYDELSALVFVTSMAELSNVSNAGKVARETLTRLGLADAMERPMGTYSRGMRQRAKLAQALVHEPRVLLLDEPLTGTDPASRQTILDEVRARASAGTVVVFASHVLHEIEALTSELLLIARGHVVAQGSVQDIRDMLTERPHHIRVDVADPRRLAARMIELKGGVKSVRISRDETALLIATETPDATYRRVAEIVIEDGMSLSAISSPDATLESLFHDLVEHASGTSKRGLS